MKKTLVYFTEMAEGARIPREPFEGEDIYPNFPPPALDKIKKYHRLANAALEPKRTVLMELKRMNEYADVFTRKLTLCETLSPKFIADINRLGKIGKKYAEINELFAKIGQGEAEYLKYVLSSEVLPRSFEIGEEGVKMRFKPFAEDEVY